MSDKKLIITIDGTSASGKGAISRIISKKYNTVYLDTGKLYRALAKLIKESKLEGGYEDELEKLCNEISEELLADESLQDDDISHFSSIIAANLTVRNSLYKYQRDLIKSSQKIVLDGRDVGSVICPEANFKFYVEANLEVRAKRRYMQNTAYYKKNNITISDLEKSLAERDKRDMERENSPLIIPKGAHIIDNSSDNIEVIIKKITDIIDYS